MSDFFTPHASYVNIYTIVKTPCVLSIYADRRVCILGAFWSFAKSWDHFWNILFRGSPGRIGGRLLVARRSAHCFPVLWKPHFRNRGVQRANDKLGKFYLLTKLLSQKMLCNLLNLHYVLTNDCLDSVYFLEYSKRVPNPRKTRVFNVFYC